MSFRKTPRDNFDHKICYINKDDLICMLHRNSHDISSCETLLDDGRCRYGCG